MGIDGKCESSREADATKGRVSVMDDEAEGEVGPAEIFSDAAMRCMRRR